MNLHELEQLFIALLGPYNLSISRKYTPSMDALRCEVFPEANHSATNRDVCDDRAWHLTIHCAEVLAAYSQLIPGPEGFFKVLTANPLLVNSRTATDWSRFVIPASSLKIGLPEVMGAAALLLAYALGSRYVYGMATPGRQLIRLLHQLGFREVDSPVSITVLPGETFSLQLFTCDLKEVPYSPKE